MNIAIILTIVGLILTVYFGWHGLRVREPGRIAFVRQSVISLLDSVAEGMADLKITYKDKPITQNLILLRGYIINLGAIDIKESDTESPISLHLKEPFRWISARVVTRSSGLTGRLQQGSNAISLHTNLLRRNEFIEIEAIAECGAEMSEESASEECDTIVRFKRALAFDHRIANTGRIEHRVIPDTEVRPRSAFRDYLPSLIAALFGICTALLFGASFWYMSGYSVGYEVAVGDGAARMPVSVRASDTGLVVVRSPDGTVGGEYEAREAPAIFPIPQYEPLEAVGRWGVLTFGLVLFLLSVLASTVELRDRSKLRQIRRIINR